MAESVVLFDQRRKQAAGEVETEGDLARYVLEIPRHFVHQRKCLMNISDHRPTQSPATWSGLSDVTETTGLTSGLKLRKLHSQPNPLQAPLALLA